MKVDNVPRKLIHEYDGYRNEPIFKDQESSTYYDAMTDMQCTVPLSKSLEKLKAELGIARHNSNEKDKIQDKGKSLVKKNNR